MFIKSKRINFSVGVLACTYLNSCCYMTVQTQIPWLRTQTQGAQVIHGHYCNGYIEIGYGRN